MRGALIAQVVVLAAGLAWAPVAYGERPLDRAPLATPLTCLSGNCIFGDIADLAFSSDGRFAYATYGPDEETDLPGGAVVVLGRDPNSGALRELSCVSDSGSDGACTDGDRLDGAGSIALSPGGASVYVSTATGVATFARDPASGQITQVDCLAHEPAGPACRAGPPQPGPLLLVTPDGDLYTAGARGILQFRPNDEGLLQFAGCLARVASAVCANADARLPLVSDIAAGHSGTRVVVVGNGLATLARDPDTGALSILDCRRVRGCTPDDDLKNASTLAITSTADRVYAGTARDARDLEGAVLTYSVDPGSGVLEQGPCYADRYDQDFERCAPVKGLEWLEQLALSPDGRELWAAGAAFQSFRVNRRTGALVATGCSDDHELECSWLGAIGVAGLIWGPGGELYLPGGIYSDDPRAPGVAVLAPAPWVATQRVRVDSDGAARLRVRCPAARAGACSGRISVLRARSPSRLGRGGYEAEPGASGYAYIRLGFSAMRRLRERRSISPRVLLHDSRAVLAPSTRRIVITSPRQK